MFFSFSDRAVRNHASPAVQTQGNPLLRHTRYVKILRRDVFRALSVIWVIDRYAADYFGRGFVMQWQSVHERCEPELSFWDLAFLLWRPLDAVSWTAQPGTELIVAAGVLPGIIKAQPCAYAAELLWPGGTHRSGVSFRDVLYRGHDHRNFVVGHNILALSCMDCLETYYQCWGSGSAGSAYFWASRIRIH